MKNKITRIVCTVGIALCLVISLSCDNFMDIHQEYIKDGERVYAPIVDSVTVFAGKGKVMMKLRYFNGHNLKHSTIYWNDKHDSLQVDLAQYDISAGLDSIEVTIPDLVESAYSFYIVNYDSHGNRSLEVSTFGNAYGVDFQNSILNRSIKSLANFDDRFEIEWAAPSDQLVNVELKYIDELGNEISVVRDIENVGTYAKARDDEFVYRSYFLPEENALDLFYTEWSEPIKLPPAK